MRPEVLHPQVVVLLSRLGETLAKHLLILFATRTSQPAPQNRSSQVLNLDQIKITRRDQEVLKLLVEGCSNKEIAAELTISPRTV